MKPQLQCPLTNFNEIQASVLLACWQHPATPAAGVSMAAGLQAGTANDTLSGSDMLT
jgi:hypothetical protein